MLQHASELKDTPLQPLLEGKSIALPSGYQRDLQLTKSALIRGTLASVDGLRQIPSVLAEMTLNTEAMAEAIEPAMYMTEKAVQLAAEGMSFREAYRVAAQQ